MKLSVIVPCHNEEETVLEVLEQVKRQEGCGAELETIVIDDGSTDRTRELLKGRPDLYARLVCFDRNRGKGMAVKAGLEVARGDYVLFQDADLEYHPSEYPRLVRPALELGADVVMGSRTLAPALRRVHSFRNLLGNALITGVFNLLYDKTFSDIYTCYLMFRRSLIDSGELRAFGFDGQAELLAKCVKRGRIFYEVPISYHARTVEEGKKIRALDAVWVLTAMIRERFKRDRRADAPTAV